ncbi:pyridoxal phosphate-dependent decarboxylase family protein [Pseudalkalibacillus decolorationis]|uniref:pyridoxal phosphate-dependent decarboxylase family protein n=1 Tax=Pseudalkalibacillus decolorationis TaxID=163879 RepID=UPI002148FF57|nr:aspartate aminotransferase family protein [Pseudalkalibacillus decolorationis]
MNSTEKRMDVRKENVDRFTFDSLFLHGGEGIAAYDHATRLVSKKLIDVLSDESKPYIGKSPAAIEHEIKQLEIATEQGDTLENLLGDIEETILKSNINIFNPKSVAHLHCPPLLPALVAEMILTVFNQSMDSWDQSTAATYLEEEMVNWLTRQFKLSSKSGGTFTSGGTQSNYMGLLLARDAFCMKHWQHNIQMDGLPGEANKLRILCSESAHFTVKKSASQLGLGERSVVMVKTDEQQRMCMQDLQTKLNQIEEIGLLPFALVGTCGTTDFGSIDPLEELADIAKLHKLWFHVDAAYGGALILSKSHADQLSGIEQADSITVDFHKLFYQPISCGAFLVNDQRNFRFIHHTADYLNPESDEEIGIVHLVSKSTQTTRRFDALKLFMSLRIVGTERFAAMIDGTFRLAQDTVKEIEEREAFTVINTKPELNAVVFRFQPAFLNDSKLNDLNKAIQKVMFENGEAVMAKTAVNGATFLKFTLLNPRTTMKDINEILTKIEEHGSRLIANGGKNLD